MFSSHSPLFRFPATIVVVLLSQAYILHPQSSLPFSAFSSWRLWTRPGGAPGNHPWSGPPTSGRVLRFAPIPSSLSSRHISHPQSSLHFYTLSSWRLWTRQEELLVIRAADARRTGAKVRSYPVSLSLFLQGGGMKWSAPCYFYVLVVVVV